MHPGSASGLRIADWQQQARPEFQHMPIPTFPANPGSSTNHFSNTGMAYNDMRSLSPVCSTRHMYRQDQGSPCIMQHGSGNPGAAGMQQQQAAQPLLAEQYWPQEYNVTHNHTEPLPSRLYMPMQGQPGSNNLGMGQHAMAAAAGDAFLQPSSAQQTHPQSWLPAMQLSNARNMSPYLHQSSDLPLQHQVPSGSTHQHAVYQSADLDASRRSHSEDMTRFPSLGTSVYSNRTGSGGLTVSQRDMVGPAVASPQSSRSSSLPSMSPHLPIAQARIQRCVTVKAVHDPRSE